MVGLVGSDATSTTALYEEEASGAMRCEVNRALAARAPGTYGCPQPIALASCSDLLEDDSVQ